MGLSLSSSALGLGLVLWLVGERVLSASAMRTGVGGAAALCFVLALVLELRALGRVDAGVRHGLRSRLGAGALVAFSAGVYAACGWLRIDVTHSVLAFLWLAPLLWGVPARLAADRAFRTGPLDAERIATRSRAGFGFGVALSVVALVNYEAFVHDVRRDFSYRAAGEPSAQVRELVTQLEEPVQVRLFFEQGNEVVPAIAPYFDALAAISPRVSVRIEDAALSPELLRKHNVRGNGYALLLMVRDGAERGESFHIGDDLRDARRVLKTLDAHMANHLSVLARPVRPVYLTTGHGERSVAGDIAESRGRWLRDFEQLLARFNVRTHRLGVAQGLAREVPADAAAVLVLGPERPFLEEEVAALRAYASRGGRLWIALEPGVDAGLTSLLSLTGVTALGPPLLCDESFVVRTRTAADRELIQTRRYGNHRVTQAVRGRRERPHVVLVRATGLSLAAPELAVQRVTAVESEADCYLDADDDHARGPSEALGSRALLVAATVAGLAPSGVEGRIVISGDGDLPTDQVLRNEANTLIVLDLMRWLVGEDSMRAVATLEDDLPVLHQRTEDRMWFYLSAFGVPAPLFALAALRFRRRQARATRA